MLAALVLLLTLMQVSPAVADPTPVGSPTPSEEATPAAKKGAVPTPSQTPSPSESSSASPEPSKQPSPDPRETREPKPSESSTPSESPKPSESSTPSESPKPSESSTPSESPKPSESAEPSASAEPQAQDPDAADDGGIVPQVVPPATGNNAVITVKVGGVRTSQTAVGDLGGVQLGLYLTAGAANPVNNTWAVCTSDADGDCSITVPNTQPVGANRDRRFWVKQISTAAGYYTNPELGTGDDGRRRSVPVPDRHPAARRHDVPVDGRLHDLDRQHQQ